MITAATATNLRRVEDDYQDAVHAAEAFRQVRNAAVLAAVRDGCTHAEIAEATGLSRGRINQIAQSA